jgi:putative sterol carrier protein
MVSEELNELLEKIKAKIEDGKLSIDDLEDYMKIFADICNNSEDIADEIDGWNRTLAFKVRGVKNFWMKVQDGKFSWGMGDPADADLTLEMDEHVILGIFSGEVDATAAYMSEDLKVTGPLTDAIKFRTLTEIVTDEFGL